MDTDQHDTEPANENQHEQLAQPSLTGSVHSKLARGARAGYLQNHRMLMTGCNLRQNSFGTLRLEGNDKPSHVLSKMTGLPHPQQNGGQFPSAR